MPLPRTSAVVAPGPHDVRGRRNSLRFTQPPSNLHTAAISFNIRRQIRLEPASDAPCSPFRPPNADPSPPAPLRARPSHPPPRPPAMGAEAPPVCRHPLVVTAVATPPPAGPRSRPTHGGWKMRRRGDSYLAISGTAANHPPEGPSPPSTWSRAPPGWPARATPLVGESAKWPLEATLHGTARTASREPGGWRRRCAR